MKNVEQMHRAFGWILLVVFHIIVYAFILTYFRTTLNILMYYTVLVSIIFLLVDGWRFRREVKLAYISSFFTFGMVLALAFTTNWIDRYILCVGFIALQLGIYKFLSGKIMLSIPFKVRHVALAT